MTKQQYDRVVQHLRDIYMEIDEIENSDHHERVTNAVRELSITLAEQFADDAFQEAANV